MSKKKKRIKRKSKAKKLDQIITGVFIYWIAFITVMIVIFCVKDSVPDTLVQYGLGGGAVELLISGFIEVIKTKIYAKLQVAPAQPEQTDITGDDQIEAILENDRGGRG